MAPVGHASMQRRQVPQWSVAGASGSRSRSVITSQRKKNEPPVRWLLACLPVRQVAGCRLVGRAKDHVRILPHPAYPRALCPRLFHHWGTVHESAHPHITEPLPDERHQGLQALLHRFVIVAPVGVGAELRRIRVRLPRWRVVVVRQADHALRPGYQLARIQANVEVVGHVGHITVTPFAQPLLQAWSFVFKECRARHATGEKPEAVGFGFQQRALLGRGRHAGKVSFQQSAPKTATCSSRAATCSNPLTPSFRMCLFGTHNDRTTLQHHHLEAPGPREKQETTWRSP